MAMQGVYERLILPYCSIPGEFREADERRTDLQDLRKNYDKAQQEVLASNNGRRPSIEETNKKHYQNLEEYIRELGRALSALDASNVEEGAASFAKSVKDWCLKLENADPDREIRALTPNQYQDIISKGVRLCKAKLPELLNKLPARDSLQAKAVIEALECLEKIEHSRPTCTLYARNSDVAEETGPGARGVLTGVESTMTTSVQNKGLVDRLLLPAIVISSGAVLLGIVVMYFHHRSKPKAAQNPQQVQALQSPQSPYLQRPYPQNVSYRPMPVNNGGYGGYPMSNPYSQQPEGGAPGGIGYGNPYNPYNPYGNPYSSVNLAQYAG